MSLKLIDEGWIPMVADNVYVYHAGGSSVEDTRRLALAQAGESAMCTIHSAIRVHMAALSAREPEVLRQKGHGKTSMPPKRNFGWKSDLPFRHEPCATRMWVRMVSDGGEGHATQMKGSALFGLGEWPTVSPHPCRFGNRAARSCGVV